jgi:hypothetical protein
MNKSVNKTAAEARESYIAAKTKVSRTRMLWRWLPLADTFEKLEEFRKQLADDYGKIDREVYDILYAKMDANFTLKQLDDVKEANTIERIRYLYDRLKTVPGDEIMENATLLKWVSLSTTEGGIDEVLAHINDANKKASAIAKTSGLSKKLEILRKDANLL